MATAGELIRGSLRLIGQLAEGEIPSNETYEDALSALNEMIDAWSIDSLTVFTTVEQAITWPSGQASRRIGPTGQIVALRPSRLDESTYLVRDGVSHPLTIINQEEYRAIPYKETTAPYPTYVYADMEVPNVQLHVYPVPTEDIDMRLVSAQAITQPATILTTITVPPGYQRAFRYNLAVALAAEFGKEPPAWVVRIATQSKAALERINDPMQIMGFPASLPGISTRADINQG